MKTGRQSASRKLKSIDQAFDAGMGGALGKCGRLGSNTAHCGALSVQITPCGGMRLRSSKMLTRTPHKPGRAEAPAGLVAASGHTIIPADFAFAVNGVFDEESVGRAVATAEFLAIPAPACPRADRIGVDQERHRPAKALAGVRHPVTPAAAAP